jgi:hypothetical protein
MPPMDHAFSTIDAVGRPAGAAEYGSECGRNSIQPRDGGYNSPLAMVREHVLLVGDEIGKAPAGRFVVARYPS